MIAAACSSAGALAGLRAAWTSSGRVLFLENAVDAAVAAELRELIAPALGPFYLADRGRYLQADATPLADLLEPVRRLAAAVSGEPLRLLSATWLRFGPGDYALMKDSRGGAEQAIEATLDLSAAACEAASFSYLRPGGATVPFEARPLSLALIDRRPGALRSDRYLPVSAGPAEVWRLRAAFVGT